MIKLEKTEVFGWEAAIRGMRNPLNSWAKSDSCFEAKENEDGSVNWDEEVFRVGYNDFDLMKRLCNGHADDRKFMRMLNVTVDITAPLYWWKEFDTYKVGTVANSCSTMHTIHTKPFTLDDFSHEQLTGTSETVLLQLIDTLNLYRDLYNDKKISYTPEQRKECWYQMIQLLPTSFNQKRTVQMNYEVLVNMYRARRNHKLAEWHGLCDWIMTLPCSELISLSSGK